MKFKDSLKTKDLVITAHASLTEALDAESLRRQGELLGPFVDAVQLTDSAHRQMSGIAAAAILMQQGIDPIVHMNCRDRNRVAVQKDLIGAAALGVSSILIMRGQSIKEKKSVEARNVFDISALDLMGYIQSLKEADDSSPISEFLVGANAEMFEPDDNWTPTNLVRKCDAGANFVQLQMCFDMELARRYMAGMISARLTHRASFIMALAPLQSRKMVRWVRNNVKGTKIPKPIVERLVKAKDPDQEGIEICAELMREAAAIPGVSGINLLSLGELDVIPAVIEASGLR